MKGCRRVLKGFWWVGVVLGLGFLGRASIAGEGDRGTIYAYSDGGRDAKGTVSQGVFAFDPARKTWTKVAEQSESATSDTRFRVTRDGRYLAFVKRTRQKESNPKEAGVLIRDMDQDGAIREIDSAAGNPVWSGDGKRMLVAAALGMDRATKLFRMETWVVNADGTEAGRLAIPESEEVKDWSPDGSWIVAVSRRDGGAYQVYRMKMDGTEARRLTTITRGVIHIDPRISPDGRKIAWFRVGDASSGIWVMDADGSNSRRVFEAKPDAYPGGPSWSPDGKTLAFKVHTVARNAKGHEEWSNPRLILQDVDGGETVTVKSPLPDGLGEPEWAVSRKR